MNWAARLIGGRFHYGWLTVAVVFLVLLAATLHQCSSSEGKIIKGLHGRTPPFHFCPSQVPPHGFKSLHDYMAVCVTPEVPEVPEVLCQREWNMNMKGTLDQEQDQDEANEEERCGTEHRRGPCASG